MSSIFKYGILIGSLLLILGFTIVDFNVTDAVPNLGQNANFEDSHFNYDSIFYFNPAYLTKSFDYPVGKPDAKHYYLASRFGSNNHLGEDWNGRGGGDTDLGDPVYAIGDGLVTVAKDVCCGWGNVVRVVHKLEGHSEYRYLESVYAHLDKMSVRPGQLLKKGQHLGTIGTAHGKYKAHLHLELRDFLDMSMGPGYSKDWEGYLDPSAFIRNNRRF